MNSANSVWGSATILIIGVSQNNWSILESAFQRIGCRVRRAETTEVLWQWISNKEGDLVIIDMAMLEDDASYLLQRIDKTRPELPIIVFTNIRELESLMQRLMKLTPGSSINVDTAEAQLSITQKSEVPSPDKIDASLGAAVEKHLTRYFEAHEDGLPPAGVYGRILREMERPLITMSLVATNGNQIKAAQLLGINRNTLRKKIRALDISVVRILK